MLPTLNHTSSSENHSPDYTLESPGDLLKRWRLGFPPKDYSVLGLRTASLCLKSSPAGPSEQQVLTGTALIKYLDSMFSH